MNKLNLKDILLIENVKENIRGNISIISSEIEHAIDLTINCIKDNSAKVEITVEGEKISFENTLYVDLDKNLYLLDSRGFRECDDSMVGVYLEVFNEKGEIVEEVIDDVWSYANWTTFK